MSALNGRDLKMGKKTIFLDRDGTIIIDKIYLNEPEAIEYLPGAFEALRILRDHGYSFVIVTNQSGVARGIVSIKNLYRIHEIIRADFARQGVDFLGFYYAPYLVESEHPFRKPRPGMLLQAMHDFNISPEESWMIGDRMTDVEAGHRAQTKSILLEGVETPYSSPYQPPEAFVKDLLEASSVILNWERKNVNPIKSEKIVKS